MSFPAFIALFAGSTRVLSRTANAHVAMRFGIIRSSALNYFYGVLFSAIALIISGQSTGFLTAYILIVLCWGALSAIFGLSFVALSSFLAPKIPALRMTILLFIGQICTGYLIDFLADTVPGINDAAGVFLVITGLVVIRQVPYGRSQ